MITVLPLRDDLRKKQLLKAVSAGHPDGQVLTMQEGGEELGFAVLDVEASVLRIHRLCVHGDDPGGMLTDFLMRSAASYAANFGAYQIEMYDRDFLDFFCRRGFEKRGLCAAIPMSRIVRVHKPDS